MNLQIQRVGNELPGDFCDLVEVARTEGHRLLDRLAHEWSTGELRFDQPNESLLVARIDGKIVGVGGITIEPTDPAALRMRRFYVVPTARRQGVAKALVEALVSEVADPGIIGVHVGVPSAFPFWETVGFGKIDMAGIAHRWVTTS